MKLTYHEGQNFGDAINPLIFNYFLGENFFDQDESTVFLPIGSILGLKKSKGKKIVFSSGYAAGDEHTYGTAPVIDDTYEIYCVRGKETAKALNIPEDKAVTDGAILLSELPFSKVDVKYDVSFIPHVFSLTYYSDFEELCAECGIYFIDPRGEINSVLSDIRSSKLVLTEAMHGAIVADTFRVPWVPIQMYPQVNTFKWKDWCGSLEMEYKPLVCKTYLHDELFFTKLFQDKFKFLPHAVVKFSANITFNYKRRILKSFLKKALASKHYLSNKTVFDERKSRLLVLLQKFKEKYQTI